MALSTLRVGVRPLLFRQFAVYRLSIPMSGKAYDELKANHWDKNKPPTAMEEMQMFWDRNIRLKRPVSPWTKYEPPFTMRFSFFHRYTGITMGVILYTFSIGLFVAPWSFPEIIGYIQSLELHPGILWGCKTYAAWTLLYHYFNGMRHLGWDAGKGTELEVQMRTGLMAAIGSGLLAAGLAAAAYM